MSRPATRLLSMLELLQDRQRVSGADLAERLEVDERTVRRYATKLQELGIPVEGERGRAGGYRLRPGYKLPPLMLDEDEATAVVVALVAAQRFGIATGDAALAKIRRVLPVALRERVRAVEETLGFTRAPGHEGDAAPATETVLALADAARRGRRVSAVYESRRRTPGGRDPEAAGRRGGVGQGSRRELDPYGLVLHGGRWYLSALDHSTGEPRIFRADRTTDVKDVGRAAPPPPGFDAEDHVARSLARVPWRHEVEVVLRGAAYADVRRRVPATMAELEPRGDGGVLMRARAERLDGMARLLAGLGFDFEIVKPDELRDAVAALAERLRAAASSGAAAG